MTGVTSVAAAVSNEISSLEQISGTWHLVCNYLSEKWFFLIFYSIEQKIPGFYFLFIFKDFIYIFLERGEGRRKRGRETSMCGCLSHVPHWGPGWQPRHLPWLGIEPVALWFTSWRSMPGQIPRLLKASIASLKFDPRVHQHLVSLCLYYGYRTWKAVILSVMVWHGHVIHSLIYSKMAIKCQFCVNNLGRKCSSQQKRKCSCLYELTS